MMSERKTFKELPYLSRLASIAICFKLIGVPCFIFMFAAVYFTSMVPYVALWVVLAVAAFALFYRYYRWFKTTPKSENIKKRHALYMYFYLLSSYVLAVMVMAHFHPTPLVGGSIMAVTGLLMAACVFKYMLFYTALPIYTWYEKTLT
ncbi:MAG: hypothetical protein ACI9TY_001593 [Alphaproteobacteria bacterium]|jgi:hypothetical protein